MLRPQDAREETEARQFTGEDGSPTVEGLRRISGAGPPDAEFQVQDDIIP